MAKPTKHIFTTGQVVTNKQGQQAIVKQKEARGYSFTALGGVYEYDFHCANTSIVTVTCVIAPYSIGTTPV